VLGALVIMMFRTAVTVLALLVATSASAQVDLSGTWMLRNFSDALMTAPGAGPLPVDFMGMPFNDSGRARALSHDPSEISVPDHICIPYSPPYIMLGPFGLKITNDIDPVNASLLSVRIEPWNDMAPITIWMDGRPHPSEYAPHEVTGFTTGTWENDVLVASTTHMKESVSRRNGAPLSDRAAMRLRFLRHGDLLTLTARIEDPVNFDGPYYLTRVFQLIGTPLARNSTMCAPSYEGVPEGVVRHLDPDQNPFVDEMTKLYNIPREAVLGGKETMYPEFRKKLKGGYVIPEKCPSISGQEGISPCGGPGVYPRVPKN
jgi:hypothetical protein